MAVRQPRRDLHGALEPRKAREPRVPKRRAIQNRTTSPQKLPSQHTAISVPSENTPEDAV